MKIIAFEGLDKSGKHTAMDLTYDYLTHKGYKVERVSFPRYNSYIGKAIRGWLTAHEDFKDYNDFQFEVLQNADKLLFQPEIKKLEQEGTDFLLLDRYVLSQFAYGLIKNDFDLILDMTKPIKSPNLTFYFDVTPENSMSRKGEHGDNDKYENDKDILTKARENYLSLISKNLFSDEFVTFDSNKGYEEMKSTFENYLRETF